MMQKAGCALLSRPTALIKDYRAAMRELTHTLLEAQPL